jgi:hypothetical protein
MHLVDFLTTLLRLCKLTGPIGLSHNLHCFVFSLEHMQYDTSKTVCDALFVM